jgi:hypothetical protein
LPRQAARPTAHRGAVVIKRLISGREQTIKINYRDILSGKRNDEILRDTDTVYLEEAIF